MRLSNKFFAIVAAVAFVAVLAGCSTFTPKTTGAGAKMLTHDFGGIEFVYIPSGAYKFPGEDGTVQTIENLKGFWISRTEITVGQYRHVVKTKPCEDANDEMPVTNVSWVDAAEFCLQLSEDSGGAYSLPTEEQWEYAARAGSASDYYFGCDIALLGSYEWTKENAKGKVQYPARKPCNLFGLYDVLGNVREWCMDTSDDGSKKAIRGGCVNCLGATTTVERRSESCPLTKSDALGFRVVRGKLRTQL